MFKRNKRVVIFVSALFVCAMYMFVSVNNAIVTDTAALITNELENAKSYGQIYLKFDGVSEENAPKILINGEHVCTVTESAKTLDVFDMCVAELDTRALSEPVLLSIEGKSTNVMTNCAGRVITGNGGIDNIGTFVIKDVGNEK